MLASTCTHISTKEGYIVPEIAQQIHELELAIKN